MSVLNKHQVSIVEKLDNYRTEIIKLNRSRLIHIIECVVLCGRQELSLRGYRDFGNISGKLIILTCICLFVYYIYTIICALFIPNIFYIY